MNNYTQYQNAQTQSRATAYDEGLRAYMIQVYNFMGLALALSGLVAWFTASTPALMQAIYGTPLSWVVMLAPLGFVLFMSFRLQKLSYGAAQLTFWLFAAVMGLSLSWIFMVYTGASVARVFFITASVFGAMSLYGYTTKRDLTGIGSFLFMGLIGIIIASLVNLFLKSTGLQFAISVIGVLIFVGLTAYDTQRIKQVYFQISRDGSMLGKAAIMGALSLYLDFINLFIHLLQFMGDRR
ncbi:MAG: Bax inhibitor-1/YccA family protein [Hyphomicrobiales bacterium]|nr:Bax inhibitor-1/YccA family protein [Hyphomicrobiales bacterium]